MNKIIRSLLVATCLLAAASLARADQLMISFGETVRNSLGDSKTTKGKSWLLDYRKPISPDFDVAARWFNQGSPKEFPKIDGPVVELYYRLPVSIDSGRVSLHVGTGPYLYFATTQEGSSGGFRDKHGMGWIFSFEGYYKFAERWAIGGGFDRVTMKNTTVDGSPRGLDTDLLTLKLVRFF